MLPPEFLPAQRYLMTQIIHLLCRCKRAQLLCDSNHKVEFGPLTFVLKFWQIIKIDFMFD